MAPKGRIPEKWKDDEKLTVLQPVVVFKRLTNNKLKKYTKTKSRQVSETYDNDDKNIRVSRFGRRIKHKRYPGFEDNIETRLNRTMIKKTNPVSVVTQKAGCSNDQTKKSKKTRKPKGTTTFKKKDLPIINDNTQNMFDQIMNNTLLEYINGEKFQSDKEDEKFWEQVNPNEQKVISQKVDDVSKCLIKYLDCAIISDDINNLQLTQIHNELLIKIQIVNNHLELEQVKQIVL